MNNKLFRLFADIGPEVNREDVENDDEIDELEYRCMEWNNSVEGIKCKLLVDMVPTFNDNGKITVVDDALWQTRFSNIFHAVIENSKNKQSKYVPMPKSVKIIFNNNDLGEENNIKKNNNNEKINTNSENNTKTEVSSITLREPRWSFDDIYLPNDTKETIDKSLLIARHKDTLFNKWKLGNGNGMGRAVVFNFFGPPGTGKSMTGEAIASMLEKKVYNVNYSELESKYVGETPKNITAVFKKATEDDAVLIFDEADSFLGKRLTSVQQSADYGVNITRSVMLMELEKFSGVVIFTTNLIKNYDDAFKRRILASIEFKMPDVTGREKIWDLYFDRGIPMGSDINAKVLAEKFTDISGADIKDIILYTAVSALHRSEEEPLLTMADFEEAYEVIRLRSKKNVPEVKVIHETVDEAQYLRETGETNGKATD